MKVFISSLITGMGPLRKAARDAVTALGFQPIMAEDFVARPTSSQIACLEGVRQSDVIVLLLCDKYGAKQASGISATHEEYREAKDRKPIIAFVQQGVSYEPQQQEFLNEVQGWERGLFRDGFTDAADLQPKVTRCLHEWHLSNATGSVDPKELLARAKSLVPVESRSRQDFQTSLVITIAFGPTQSILRPNEIEQPSLAENIMQTALFGNKQILDSKRGTNHSVDGPTLIISQESGGMITINEGGDIVIKLPFEKKNPGFFPVLIHEDVESLMARAITFADWLVERIDPTQRMTHCVMVSKISGSGLMLAWQTRSENEVSQSRKGLSVASYGNSDDRLPVHLTPPDRKRVALKYDAGRIVEDLVTLLRRQWKS